MDWARSVGSFCSADAGEQALGPARFAVDWPRFPSLTQPRTRHRKVLAFQPLEVTYLLARKQALQVCRGTIALDDDMASAIAKKSRLRHINLGGFGRTEEDVAVGRVRTLHKQIWRNASSEMIASACCDVQGAEDFFVLNIFPAGRQLLRPEPEFAQFANHGVREQTGIMVIDGSWIP